MRELRDIKFRGRRVANGEWLYGDLSRVNEQTLIHPHFTEPFEYPEDHDENVDPNTVGQYTGLKDTDGNEIWEGDIIENSFSRRDGFCYKCIWYGDTGQWMFDPFMKGNEDAPLLGIEEFLQTWETVGEDGWVQVIGNIHNDRNLLKGDAANE